MPEAQLGDFGSGLTPVAQGWFGVNVRDAEWWSSDGRGARCAFENECGNSPVELVDGRAIPARATAELGSAAVGVASL